MKKMALKRFKEINEIYENFEVDNLIVHP